MGFYVLTNGEGSYIRKDVSGKYVPVRSIKQAFQWDSKIKANSVLNSSIAKAIRKNYYVQLIGTEEIVDKDCVNIQKELCSRTIEEGKIDDWQEKINVVMQVLSGSDERFEELSSKISEIDKEIVDLQHYIEFGKFNCYQGWLCFKMLQKTLQQRRKYKNELAVINLIRQCKFDKTSLEELKIMIADIQNKCYRPRAFPELFKGKSN